MKFREILSARLPSVNIILNFLSLCSRATAISNPEKPVTGSGRGIGAAIALRLAVHGADVVINYVHSAAAAEEVAAKARREHGVRAICIQADVSNKEDIGRLFQTAIKEMDHLDIVMSNSGIEHFNSLENTTEEEIDKTFAVNVKAQYFVAQQCSKYMADNGRLILISSISAVKVSFLHQTTSCQRNYHKKRADILPVGNSETCYICCLQSRHYGYGEVSGL